MKNQWRLYNASLSSWIIASVQSKWGIGAQEYSYLENDWLISSEDTIRMHFYKDI